MPIPANASIRVRIIGGVRAALEAEDLADALQDVGQNAGRAGRSAVVAAFGFRLMARELRKVFTASNLASVGLWAFSTAAFAAKVIALGLASIAIPALVLALWSVGVAAATVATAFIGGMLGILAAAAVMAVGVVGRFQLMKDVAGSSANDLAGQAGMLRGAWRDAIAPGADALMKGLADGLGFLIPLVKELSPAFTALGTAFGGAFSDLMRDLASQGPQISAMFDALVPAIAASGDAFGAFLGLLIQIATVGAPLFAGAMQWAADIMRGWTGAFDNDTLNGAQRTLSDFAAGVRTFFDAFTKPLKPIFGPAMSDMASATSKIAGPLGTVLGTVLATMMRIGVAALPYVVKGIEWLARVIPGVIRWFEKAGKTIVDTFAPARPFFENVLAPLFTGIGKAVFGVAKFALEAVGAIMVGLGWLGSKLGWAKGIFEAIGYVIGFVFSGGLIKAIGIIVKALPSFGWLGKAIEVVGGIIGKVIGGGIKAIDWLIGSFGYLASGIAAVATTIGGLGVKFWDSFASGATTVFGAIKTTVVSVLNWIIDKLNFFIGVYNSTFGKLGGHFGIPDLTLGEIGRIPDGTGTGATGPTGGSLGDGPRGGLPTSPVPSRTSYASFASPATPALAGAAAGGGGGGGPRQLNVNLNIDGRTLQTEQTRLDIDDEDRG